MTRLTLSLLGTFAASLDGAPIVGFRSAKTRALLAYLAVEHGRDHPREALVDLLWPDQPFQSANTNFRQTLSRLQRLLHNKTAVPPFLHVTRQTVRWESASDTDLDLLRVQDALAAPDSPAALQAALDAYPGDFLAGFFAQDAAGFEDWAAVVRENLHRQIDDGFRRFLEHTAAVGDHATTAEYARRQIARSPWDETAHRHLMLALALQGQRSAALAQFDACADLLADELGVSPAPETFALFEAIRDGELGAGPDLLAGAATQRRHNLPQALPPLFGREAELAAIHDLLAQRRYRLITLTGQGGVGKTRLALEAATRQRDSFAHGVWFVSLAGADTAEAVIPAIADALSIQFVGERPLAEQLVARLRDKELLLLLDNLEHLPEDVADIVADLLQQTQRLVVLATSRHRLFLRIETLLPIEGLPVPATGATEPDAFPSISLFVEQARRLNPRARPDLAQVSTICSLLEGLPLGIELVAAQTDRRSLGDIVGELQHSLSGVATRLRDIPARQRSLWAVVESSWVLLPADQQRVLAQLAIFRDSFTVDDATAVVADLALPLLEALHQQSLLQQVDERYRLHEVVREFATAQLHALPEAGPVAERHSDHYLGKVRELEPLWNGLAFATAVRRSRQNWNNLNAAWQHAIRQPAVTRLLDSVGGMRALYRFRGLYHEGADLFRAAHEALAFDAAPDTDSRRLAGWIRAAEAWFLVQLRRHAAADATLTAALAIATAEDDPHLRLDVQATRQIMLTQQDAYADCIALADEMIALADAIDAPLVAAHARDEAGFARLFMGDFAAGRALFARAVAAYREAGEVLGLIVSLRNLGLAQTLLQEFAAAEASLEEALALARERQDRERETFVIAIYGNYYLTVGDYGRGAELYREQLAFERSVGLEANIAVSLGNLGQALYLLGQYAEALDCLEEALPLMENTENRINYGTFLQIVGHIHRLLGDLDQAAAQLQQAVALGRQHGSWYLEANASRMLGDVYRVQGRLEAAAQAYEQSRALRADRQDTSRLRQSQIGLAQVALAQGDVAAAREWVTAVLSDDAWQGVTDPHLILFACYEVLQALGDAQAGPLLARAHAILLERAERISDAQQRESYLHAVPHHQAILTAWQAQQ